MIHYLRRVSQEGGDVYIFGCGSYGGVIFYTLTMSGIIVKGFFDNAYLEGGTINNKNVLPMSILSCCDKEKTYVVVAVRARKEIDRQLAQMGIIHVIGMRELAIDYHSDFPVLSFETDKEPEVSILVTAYNEWQYTYNCFMSLSKHKIRVPYEIIFGDDVSIDNNKDAERFLHGVQVIHNKQRMNYLGNINNIAKLAKGDYLILLANDTVIIQDDWIDKMLERMKEDEKIGMISGKYWIPIAGQYDTALNYGENWEQIQLDQDAPSQTVDFVWPVATMIRRKVWEAVGGFSEEFLPAFCEDNDLCMKIMDKGYKCMYMPEIETIHFCGTSYEKKEDCEQLIKEHYKLFTSKWKNYKRT